MGGTWARGGAEPPWVSGEERPIVSRSTWRQLGIFGRRWTFPWAHVGHLQDHQTRPCAPGLPTFWSFWTFRSLLWEFALGPPGFGFQSNGYSFTPSGFPIRRGVAHPRRPRAYTPHIQACSYTHTHTHKLPPSTGFQPLPDPSWQLLCTSSWVRDQQEPIALRVGAPCWPWRVSKSPASHYSDEETEA